MLVGLMGAKGAGKDTAALFLVREHGFVRLAFGDELYRESADAFGVTVDFLGLRDTKEMPLPELALSRCKNSQFVAYALRHVPMGKEQEALDAPRSPRQTLQDWGTWRRESSPTYWVQRVASVIDRAPHGTRFVITDVRQPNEAELVERYNGRMLRIRRNSVDQALAEAQKAGVATALHVTETALSGYPAEDVMNEDGDPDRMNVVLDEVVHQLARAEALALAHAAGLAA